MNHTYTLIFHNCILSICLIQQSNNNYKYKHIQYLTYQTSYMYNITNIIIISMERSLNVLLLSENIKLSYHSQMDIASIYTKLSQLYMQRTKPKVTN